MESAFSPFSPFGAFQPFAVPTNRGTSALRGSRLRGPVEEAPERRTRAAHALSPAGWSDLADAMEAAEDLLEEESGQLEARDDFDGL